MRKLAIAVGVVLLFVAVPSFADVCGSVAGNLVMNCGFETGGSDDWTVTLAPLGSFIYVLPADPHSGTYALWFGDTDNEDDSLSQNVATTPGATYDLQFWLRHDLTDSDNQFSASWNGVTEYYLFNAASFAYTLVNIPGLVATGTSTPLTFAGYEGPSEYILDDVSVVQTPEPGSILLLMTVLGLCTVRLRKAFQS
ncbi:MAG: PEP-CTERM sorting domain-containing protein [Bryobacteraceae bacterium]|jgi:hypothetical protein